MSCRDTPHGSAYTSIARLRSGLDDVQVLSTFHELRAQGETLETVPPTPGEWSDYLDATISRVQDYDLTEARRRSITNRLETARGTVPSGRDWHAVTAIGRVTHRQADVIDHHLRQYSRDMGVSFEEAQETYRSRYAEVPRGRSVQVRDGYVAVGRRRFGNIPRDHSTFTVLDQMEHEGMANVLENAAERPIVRRRPITGSPIREAGYDPETRRLEIVFHPRPGTEERVYAFRDVPAGVWDRLQGDPIRVFNAEVRNNAAYRYETAAEEARGRVQVRCEQCGQWMGSSHVCSATPPTPRLPRGPRPAAVNARNNLDLAYAERIDRGREIYEQGMSLYSAAPARVRSAATEQPVDVPFHYTGSFNNQLEGVIPDGYIMTGQGADARNRWTGWFRVDGVCTVYRPDSNTTEVDFSGMSCNCAVYTYGTPDTSPGTCPHIGFVAANVARRYEVGRISSTSVSEAQVNAALAGDWSRDESRASIAASRRMESEDGIDYSTNFAAFEEDYRAAVARKNAGEPVVEMAPAGILGGRFTRESGQGFGVEIEFDVPRNSGQSAAAVRARIGQELYEAGLTRDSRISSYHTASRAGYTDQQERGWSFEQDATVAGEVVSPIMYDEQESWDNLAEVCKIITRNGGVATVRTGSHVHVSTPNLHADTASSLLKIVTENEDTLYRVAANPATGKHRPLRWCAPNSEGPERYFGLDEVRRVASGHNGGLNMFGATGRQSDHVEFRQWDGSLNPAVIQAQVQMSTAMVDSAYRQAWGPSGGLGRESVGSHDTRLRSLLGRSRRQLTSEELEEDTGTARTFIDSLFNNRADKARMASLFAVNSWTRA